MKRLESRKSHSWWWDSHISPKNSRWLAENLEEMDRNVKQMLKLIEDDGDSFAKKAEMYYQRRPELVSHVEEFYRMYRSLAERYDQLTGELRKNIPSDLQSQGSDISDIASDLPSIWPSSNQRLSRRKSGPRAAGFSVFLGSGGSGSDLYQKEEDDLSTQTDSETESDASSVNNYSVLAGSDQGVSRKMIELEIELHEVKQKLRMLEEESTDGSVRGAKNNISELNARIKEYEGKLEIANRKIQLTEEKATWLRFELQKYKPLEAADSESSEEESVKMHKTEQIEVNQALDLENKDGVSNKDIEHADGKMQALVEELSITKEMLRGSEKEIVSLKKQYHEKIQKLQGQLDTAQRELVTWKSKLNTEKREVSKLQDRIAMLKNSLSDRDHEIQDLKIAVSDAEQKIFPEKAHIKAEISKLLEGRICLEEQLRDWEACGRSLEEDIRKVVNEKRESEERLCGEIEHLKLEIAERSDCIKVLIENLETLKAERDELEIRIVSLNEEISSRDNKIVQMHKHLHKLNAEHVKLVASAEGAHRLVEELQTKAKELKAVIERQRITILERAQEKREAIKQLCFSLEHYRDGYHWLWQAFRKMAAAFLSTANSFFPSSLSLSTSSSPSVGPALVYHNKQNVQRRRTLCKALNESPLPTPVLTKRDLSLCFITSLVLAAGNGCSNAMAAILEADDDEELLEKVKQDRKKRLERQGVISSSSKEKGYLQDLVYKLSQIGQAIDNNDLSSASSVLGGNTDKEWLKNANVAFNKLSSSPEEKTQVETFNSSLASLISSVTKNDVESSKVAFVESATAFEKWTTLAGLTGQLKGL